MPIIGTISKPVFTITVFVAILFFVSVSFAKAAPEMELEGYAWSSNIGWISLNCKTGGATGGNVCGSSNYKVTINADNTITGYAWSSNIGWIKFGGLSGFPSASGNQAVNARVVGSYPNLTLEGWARACAATLGGSCQSMSRHAESGSWDGWISLRGSNHSIRVNNFGQAQYAWGDEVVGWIDMSTRVSYQLAPSDLVITAFSRAAGNNPVPGNGTVDNVRFSATISGTINDEAFSYRLRETVSGVTQTGTYVNGVFTPPLELDGIPYGALSAELQVDLPAPGDILENDPATPADEEVAGNTRTTNFNIVPPPPDVEFVVTRTNSDTTVVRRGEMVNLSWSITAPYDVTCTAYGNISNSPTIVHSVAGGQTTSGSFNTAALQNKSVFNLVCSSIAPDVTEVVEIEVAPSAQEV